MGDKTRPWRSVCEKLVPQKQNDQNCLRIHLSIVLVGTWVIILILWDKEPSWYIASDINNSSADGCRIRPNGHRRERRDILFLRVHTVSVIHCSLSARCLDTWRRPEYVLAVRERWQHACRPHSRWITTEHRAARLPPRCATVDSVVAGCLLYRRSSIIATTSIRRYHHAFLKTSHRSMSCTHMSNIGSDCPDASGIPPYVETVAQECEGRVVGEVAAGDDSTFGDGGGIPLGMLEEVVMATMECAGSTAIATSLLQKSEQSERGSADSTLQDVAQILWYQWNDGFRPLPKDFTLPDLHPRHMWCLWVCGGCKPPLLLLPPLRSVQKSGISLPNASKRISGLRFLMTKLEVRALERGFKIRGMTPAEACTAFDAVCSAISISATTPCGRKCRLD